MTHDDSTTANIWPSETDIPGFRSFMESFFDVCHAQHTKMLQALCIGLRIPQDFFNNLLQTKPHDLRLLHYPEVEQQVLDQAGMTRAADHSAFPLLLSLPLSPNSGVRRTDPQKRTSDLSPSSSRTPPAVSKSKTKTYQGTSHPSQRNQAI